MRAKSLVALVAAGCAWSSATALQNVEIGHLACTVAEPVDVGKGDAGIAAQARHVLCAFRPKSGVEETYTGIAQLVNLSGSEKRTLLWSVKAASATPAPPGFLQQRYAADPKAPTGQIPDLIGEVNSGIVLQSMHDRKEGSAAEKSPPAAFTVLGVELKLKSAAG